MNLSRKIMISNTLILSGTINDIPDWGGSVGQYHFEEAAGAMTFYDDSDEDNHVTCINCPTNTTGVFGSALDFDGVDDQLNGDLSNSDVLSPSLTLATWINPDVIAGGQAARLITVGVDQAVLRINDAQQLSFVVELDNIAQEVTSTVVALNTWQHIAGTYDGEILRLYHNGIEVGRLDAQGVMDTSSQNLQINSAVDPFDGQMDELLLFGKALDSAKLYALAQDEVAGANSVHVGLKLFDFDGDSANPGPDSPVVWNSALVAAPNASLSAWQYQLPTNLENFYEIYLRGDDAAGNESRTNVVWRGTIDNVDPEVTFTGRHIGTGTAAQTEYTFIVTDFLLHPDRIEHPCTDTDLVSTFYSGTGTARDDQLNQVTATCRVLGHVTEEVNVTACDLAGNCTTEAVVMGSPNNDGNLVITNPAHNSVISTTLPTTIEGGAYTADGIELVTVLVDDNPVDTLNMGGVITDSTWAIDWLPTGPGNYVITAVMTDTLNNTFTDVVAVTLTGYVLDVTTMGTGTGTVSSDITGIDCGVDCMETFAPSTAVTLTAVPAAGSIFNGWSGACTGLDDCALTMDAMHSVTAEFALPGITVAPVALTVDETGTTDLFTITLDAIPAQPVTVTLGTDDNGECTVLPAQLVLDASNWQTGLSGAVTGVVDNTDDGDQTCTVLTGAAESDDPLYDTMAVDDVVVNVIDVDGVPSINFSEAVVTVDEGGTAVSVTVSLSHPSASPIDVVVTSSDDSALASLDYTAVSETVTIAPAETLAVVQIPINDDSLDEPTELFDLTLSAPVNADIGLNNTMSVEITDNDGPVTMAIFDNSGMEMDVLNSMTFTVSLSAASGYTVTVDYATADETAVANDHYTPISGTLTFAPGGTTQTIDVPILGDTEYDPDVTFLVQLSNVNYATVVDNAATGTIYNDDLTFVYLPMIVNDYPQGPDLIVEDLVVSNGNVEVTITNQGDTAVTDAFWVDVYINPSTPPMAVNQTIKTLNSFGAVWGVTSSVLPLEPGESMTLHLNDVYYRASDSNMPASVVAGTTVFAQVDSAHNNQWYGAVLESHERRDQPYNNILIEVAH